jgi:RNA polymerase sigma-70 factor (ECF subfamily)
MLKNFPLASLFLERSKVHSVLPIDMERLEELLRQAWEAGQAAWPGIYVPAETFVLHLAHHWMAPTEELTLEQQFDRLVPGDFYLACACAHGIAPAITEFNNRYLKPLPKQFASWQQRSVQPEDICQAVGEKLLVGSAGAPPKIAGYSGRGTLQNWVRIVALTTASSLFRAHKPDMEDYMEAAEKALPSSDENTELGLIKREFRDHFRTAMTEAFLMLLKKQRYLLCLYCVDKLSEPQIARMFRVDQSTISRWLQRARQQVHDETKRLLRERLGLSSQDFTSFLRLLSHLDINISRILKDAKSPPSDSSDGEEPYGPPGAPDPAPNGPPGRLKIKA